MAMTQAERMRLLSGTGWGKVPENQNQVSMDIPFFLTPEYHQHKQFRQHNEEARMGAIIGRERQKARQAERTERHKKQTVAFGIFCAVVLLVVGAVECGLLF